MIFLLFMHLVSLLAIYLVLDRLNYQNKGEFVQSFSVKCHGVLFELTAISKDNVYVLTFFHAFFSKFCRAISASKLITRSQLIN